MSSDKSLKNDILKLRNETSAALSMCKSALLESEGNYDEALNIIKKNLGSKASKKSARSTMEKAYIIRNDNGKAVILSFATETDFVLKNDVLQNFFSKLADFAFKNIDQFDDLQSFLSLLFEENKTVSDNLKSMIGIMGENINLLNLEKIVIEKGEIHTYVHGENWFQDGIGRIIVILCLFHSSDVKKVVLGDLAENICMHVCAMNPQYLFINDIDQGVIEERKKTFLDEIASIKKSQNIVDQIVAGKIKKFFKDVVLIEQDFALQNSQESGKITVAQLIDLFNKKEGSDVSISWFKRFG
ncbi:translation elongation factor Ts [Anaplasmataceae bacterium AB001_6]|nr:translation elongation factor Ts [Anaplasmataceae bacterium AB001_6]